MTRYGETAELWVEWPADMNDSPPLREADTHAVILPQTIP